MSAEKVAKEIDSIFKDSYDLKKFFASVSSTGDKEIDVWDSKSTDMVKTPSKSQVTLVPRIKSKTERNWLRGKIKDMVEENRDAIIQNIKNYIPEGVYDFKFEERKITGTGLLSYVIEAVPDGKKNAVLRIAFQGKGLSNGAGGKREDPHELMTACLILDKKVVNLQQLDGMKDGKRQEAYKKIVDDLYTTASKVVGAAGLSGFYIDPKTKNDPDLVNLAKAVSVSNFALNLIGDGKVNAVWQTGTKWANEIKKFNVGPKTIQNYNSSDIIVKFTTSGPKGATHYWGLSLKKAGLKDPEPTLLNKPAYGAKGFLTKSIPGTENNKINTKKQEFFIGAVKTKLGATEYKGEKIDKMPLKKLLKTADTLFTAREEKSDMLRGAGKFKANPNVYFREMDRVFIKYFDNNKDFFIEFLDTIFKINLDSFLSDSDFHFSLITGRGDYKDGKIMEVAAPTEKQGRTTTEIFREMFTDPDVTEYRLLPQDGKKQAFEEGATAAKLFYKMRIGKGNKGVTIVDLEVRYKGALTGEPQFQVFMSVGADSFSALYKKKVKERPPVRW
ncbi:hypothetical protein Syn7803C97_161 [Synechococcus phage S-MbCM6]|uniref:Uncharacterized protein n=2 Tax=Namakavirus smbcm6 TaxID=2734120 RepID=A0A0E3FA66_9CAUD|nr:hypothetical protein Syn7803C43_162 [Synechococcus phage ACG-2014c]AIX22714.1 hypothetical protein Syn7803C97_161 [Synechococcus phage ACG-2014c]